MENVREGGKNGLHVLNERTEGVTDLVVAVSAN
jgi:hypothetical protein